MSYSDNKFLSVLLKQLNELKNLQQDWNKTIYYGKF